MTTVLVRPLEHPPDATVRVPGSKSITNRALVAAGLAAGRSTLTGALDAADTRAMIDSISRLGARVDHDPGAGVIAVQGVAGRITSGPVELFVDQSGTTGRFVLPVAALGEGRYVVDGAPQLRARPQHDLIDALRSLGVKIDDEVDPGHLPLTVVAAGIDGGVVTLPGDVSSQFASALMLAGPCTRLGLEIDLSTEPVSAPYLELTARVMETFGATVERVSGRRWRVAAGGYSGAGLRVEPDASAASYFFAAAAITGGRVRVDGLGTDAVQGDVAFVDLLEAMGATVTRSADAIEVRGPVALRGVEADLRHISDTVPTLAVTAAFADSPTRITGVGFIRAKESDRIGAVVTELRRCGVDAIEEDDGLVVRPAEVRGAAIETYDDHRIAMSFALAGLRVPAMEITGAECVDKTFPDYFERLEGLRS